MLESLNDKFLPLFDDPALEFRLEFICQRCKDGQHQHCPGGTHCDCQHRSRE